MLPALSLQVSRQTLIVTPNPIPSPQPPVMLQPAQGLNIYAEHLLGWVGESFCSVVQKFTDMAASDALSQETRVFSEKTGIEKSQVEEAIRGGGFGKGRGSSSSDVSSGF